MNVYGFTGPRQLTASELVQVRSELAAIQSGDRSAVWLVGDAMGLDAAVRLWAIKHSINFEPYVAEGRKGWQLAARSKRMVDAIAQVGGSLNAWPNRECPGGCVPSQNVTGCGSGTWLTIAYAVYKQVPVNIYPLRSLILPSWLNQQAQPHITTQLSLF